MKRIAYIMLFITAFVCSYSCDEGGEESIKIKVESVTLNADQVTLKVNESYALNAVVLPVDAADKSIKWSSNNGEVAVVYSNGNVKAIGVGSATITVTTVDGNKSDECVVTVVAAEDEGDVPGDDPGTGGDDDGDVPGTGGDGEGDVPGDDPGTGGDVPGTGDVPGDGGDGEDYGDEDVVVNVDGVSLDKSSATIQVGESVTLVAIVTPDNATNKTVVWNSSSEDVATVVGGVVTAVGAGTTTITVTTEDGAKSATCEISVPVPLLKDVESVGTLNYTVNTPADEFHVTWEGVDNAVGYKCWYVMDGDTFEMEAEVKDNGDGTWKASSSTAMGPSIYTFYVVPIPAEGHALKDETPTSVVIVLPNLQKTGFSYRFMSDDIDEGVVYEAACYDLHVNYMNIQFLKSDKTKPIADNWYIYTTTPVNDIHHLEMWYSLNYDDDDEPIAVYSSANPGVKETRLKPDGSIKSGKWKVYYVVPEGHKYIYVEGNSKNVYMLWTSFYLCHTPIEE